MRVESLSLRNFRNYEALDVELASDGLILVRGPNGQGKTNLLEAVCFAARGRSFRQTDTDALVRTGNDTAVVRAEMWRHDRELLVESEISTTGRNRTNVNRQSVKGTRRWSESVAATSFAPDDLDLVKAGPSARRAFIDQLLLDSNERSRATFADFERALKQRNSLLRQARGRLSTEVALTLDVWDERLAQAGEMLSISRQELITQLQPSVEANYQAIAASPQTATGMELSSVWRHQGAPGELLAALGQSRETDVQRGLTTVGPQRDDVVLNINGLPARTHASQGEQRSMAISLKLAGHSHLTAKLEAPPVLLLDDIFSELDVRRTEHLLAALPKGQIFLATATEPPSGSTPVQTVNVERGAVVDGMA